MWILVSFLLAAGNAVADPILSEIKLRGTVGSDYISMQLNRGAGSDTDTGNYDEFFEDFGRMYTNNTVSLKEPVGPVDFFNDRGPQVQVPPTATIQEFVSVPEPGTLLLMATGMLLAGSQRLKKRLSRA